MSKFREIIDTEAAILHLGNGGKVSCVGMVLGEYFQIDDDGNLVLFNNNGKKTEQLISLSPHEILNPHWYIPE
jgi:hypothetical protein